jgi:hypothetical protein
MPMPSLPHPLDDHDGYDMPCAEAMLAATLALMTGHAQSGCHRHRALMAKKVTSHLFFLSRHPVMSDNFRAVMARMHGLWRALAEADAAPGVCEGLAPDAVDSEAPWGGRSHPLH